MALKDFQRQIQSGAVYEVASSGRGIDQLLPNIEVFGGVVNIYGTNIQPLAPPLNMFRTAQNFAGIDDFGVIPNYLYVELVSGNPTIVVSGLFVREVVFTPLITRTLKSGAMGDSITAQWTTVNSTNNILNSIGYETMLAYMTGRRYNMDVADNYGISGANLASMDARKATDLGGKSYDLVFFLGGANDVPAVTTQASMQTSAASMITYITGAMNNNAGIAIVISILPRTEDDGSQLTSDHQAKLTAHNAYLKSLDNGTNIIYVDANTPMCLPGTTFPNPDLFKNEANKRLHPNPAGSLVFAKAIADRLNAIYGIFDFPTANNIFVGRDFFWRYRHPQY